MWHVGAAMALTSGSQRMLNPRTPNDDVWVGKAAVQQYAEEFTGWDHTHHVLWGWDGFVATVRTRAADKSEASIPRLDFNCIFRLVA